MGADAGDGRARSALGTSAGGITHTITWTADGSGRIIAVDGELTAALGWSQDDLLGSDGFDLVHPEDRARARTQWAGFRATGGDTYAVWRLRTSTGYRWFEISDARATALPDGTVVALRLRDVDDPDEQRLTLEAAERRYRMLVENAHDVVVHAVDGIMQWVSPTVHDLLGYTAEELTGRESIDLWHPDDVGTATELRDRGTDGISDHAVLRLLHRDGHYVWVDVAVRPDDTEHPSGLVVALRDATEQVAAAEALARSEEEYRLLAENAADFVYRVGVDGRYSWVSPSVTALLGWEVDDLLGTEPSGYLHPDDLVRIREIQQARFLESGDIIDAVCITAEARARRKDGSFLWMSMSLRPLFHDGEHVGYVGSARDIEDEVGARAAAEHSRRLLATAVESAAIGMATVDLDGRFLLVNTALCRMLGHTEEWLLEHRNVDVIHEDDRLMFAEDRDLMLAGEGDVHVRSIRYVRADGSLLWTRRAAVLIRDPDGEPRSMLLQIEDLTRERQATEQLAYQAFHDGLTGLRNREWVLDALGGDLHQAIRRGTGVAVLFIDVDNFRTVNDSLGHAAGDDMLKAMAARLAGALGADRRLARFGGDEFLVVLPDVDDPVDVERIAEHIVDSVTQELLVRGRPIRPSVSIGIAVSDMSSTPAGLVRDADAALFRAKSAGKGRWQFADAGMHQEAVARLTLEGELRRALERREFVPYFQPIVSLPDRRVVGHEALVRWVHPQRGVLTPAHFLDVAEESGLLVEIGHQVFDQVCALLAARPDLPGTIAVNESPVQLSRAGWEASFLATVARHGVDARRLVVEVTETSVLDIVDEIRDALRDLRDLGVGIHVDDFGTGYSSIALLRDLPVTALKLDATFTRTLFDEGSNSAALAAGLIGLAKGLGLRGIAEGIETEEEAALLATLGWDGGQGYLFGRPAPEPVRHL